MTPLGLGRIAAIVSDSTAVTKNARADVTSEIETILNVSDPCHHIHNTVKNITDLPEFKWVRGPPSCGGFPCIVNGDKC